MVSARLVSDSVRVREQIKIHNHEKNQSTILQVMSLVWENEKTDSYRSLNAAMQELLTSLIRANVPFKEEDWKGIKDNYRGHYWLGAAPNGTFNYGEHFYAQSCSDNISSAISYEKSFNRVPFILPNNSRVYVNAKFAWAGRYWTITGWGDENTSIRAVGYTDAYDGKKGRKLEKFIRGRWLELRSEFIPC